MSRWILWSSRLGNFGSRVRKLRESILKDREGSYILIGATKENINDLNEINLRFLHQSPVVLTTGVFNGFT